MLRHRPRQRATTALPCFPAARGSPSHRMAHSFASVTASSVFGLGGGPRYTTSQPAKPAHAANAHRQPARRFHTFPILHRPDRAPLGALILALGVPQRAADDQRRERHKDEVGGAVVVPEQGDALVEQVQQVQVV